MRRIEAILIAHLLVVGFLIAVVSPISENARAGLWNTQVVDPGYMDYATSIALNSSDYPRISYMDWPNRDLKFAQWDGSAWQLQTVDTIGDVGRDASLALDSNDRAHISYWNMSSSDLKYAEWTGSGWNLQTVDSVGVVGEYTSIAVDNSGVSHISYYDETNGDLKYATQNGPLWVNNTIDSTDNVGTWTSIAVDNSGNVHISYRNESSSELKYAKWNGISWSTSTVDPTCDAGMGTSIAVDRNGYPHIAYESMWNWDLRYARWNGSGWTIETVDSASFVSAYVSIALDSVDYPHISYWEGSGLDLKYARWTGLAWLKDTVDSAGSVGSQSSIAVAGDGTVHISYHRFDTQDLKYAKGAANPPDSPATPSGPTSGVTGVPYTYSTSATDPDGDQIKYTFDWGDGNRSTTGYNNSGASAIMSHAWTAPGSYPVKAMSIDIGGAPSGWSPPLEVIIRGPPGAPTSLTATGGDQTIVLTWTAPQDDGGSPIANYAIYRSQTQGLETFLVEVGNVLTYGDSGLANGQAYFYKVAAKNAVGEGAASNEATATPSGLPGPPTGVTPVAGDRQVALSWSPPADDGGSPVTNYSIWRGTTSGGESRLETIGASTDYLDTGLTNGQTYYYTVSAGNAIGNGTNSTEVNATPLTTPSEPVNIHAEGGDGRVDLSWQAPSDDGGAPITHYRIYRGTTAGGETLLVELGSILSFVDTGVTNGQIYYYKVSAVNAAGEGAKSEESAGTPAAPTGQKPILEEMWFWLLVAIIAAMIVAAVVLLMRKRRRRRGTKPVQSERSTEELTGTQEE
jgi:fibronectin type 3 domain-containing protein